MSVPHISSSVVAKSYLRLCTVFYLPVNTLCQSFLLWWMLYSKGPLQPLNKTGIWNLFIIYLIETADQQTTKQPKQTVHSCAKEIKEDRIGNTPQVLKRKVSLRTVMSRDCTPGRFIYRRFTWFSARQCPPLISYHGQRCEVIAWGGWNFRINLYRRPTRRKKPLFFLSAAQFQVLNEFQLSIREDGLLWEGLDKARLIVSKVLIVRV